LLTRTPARTLVCSSLDARPIDVYYTVNYIYSFVTGWPRFSGLHHYPASSLTPFLSSP